MPIIIMKTFNVAIIIIVYQVMGYEEGLDYSFQERSELQNHKRSKVQNEINLIKFSDYESNLIAKNTNELNLNEKFKDLDKNNPIYTQNIQIGSQNENSEREDQKSNAFDSPENNIKDEEEVQSNDVVKEVAIKNNNLKSKTFLNVQKDSKKILANLNEKGDDNVVRDKASSELEGKLPFIEQSAKNNEGMDINDYDSSKELESNLKKRDIKYMSSSECKCGVRCSCPMSCACRQYRQVSSDKDNDQSISNYKGSSFLNKQNKVSIKSRSERKRFNGKENMNAEGHNRDALEDNMAKEHEHIDADPQFIGLGDSCLSLCDTSSSCSTRKCTTPCPTKCPTSCTTKCTTPCTTTCPPPPCCPTKCPPTCPPTTKCTTPCCPSTCPTTMCCPTTPCCRPTCKPPPPPCCESKISDSQETHNNMLPSVNLLKSTKTAIDKIQEMKSKVDNMNLKSSFDALSVKKETPPTFNDEILESLPSSIDEQKNIETNEPTIDIANRNIEMKNIFSHHSQVSPDLIEGTKFKYVPLYSSQKRSVNKVTNIQRNKRKVKPNKHLLENMNQKFDTNQPRTKDQWTQENVQENLNAKYNIKSNINDNFKYDDLRYPVKKYDEVNQDSYNSIVDANLQDTIEDNMVKNIEENESSIDNAYNDNIEFSEGNSASQQLEFSQNEAENFDTQSVETSDLNNKANSKITQSINYQPRKYSGNKHFGAYKVVNPSEYKINKGLKYKDDEEINDEIRSKRDLLDTLETIHPIEDTFIADLDNVNLRNI